MSLNFLYGFQRVSRPNFMCVARMLSLSVPYSAKSETKSPLVKMVSKATGRKEDLWQLYNEVVYPPFSESLSSDRSSDHTLDMVRRPGEVTHRREDILYSQKKLWLLGFSDNITHVQGIPFQLDLTAPGLVISLIRGLSVDQAFAHLGHLQHKGARILEEVLEEAIELAVKEHDFEYCTKIWIETVHVSRGRGVPRLLKGLRTAVHATTYHYSNLYIRLREGDPPKLYHPSNVKGAWTPSPTCPAGGRPAWGSTHDLLHEELERIRQKRLKGSL